MLTNKTGPRGEYGCEMIEKTINFFAEDELDNLRNYPFEHSRVLPPEPFSGRVTAALNSVQANKRRTRHGFDGRFRNEMLQNPPSIMALLILQEILQTKIQLRD